MTQLIEALPGVADTVPADPNARLVGRVKRPGAAPRPVLVRGGSVWDLSGVAPTTSALFELADLVATLDEVAQAEATHALGDLATEFDTSAADRPVLLSPIDLQVIKACGVTFAGSMLERLVEEQSGGDPARAAKFRSELQAGVGGETVALSTLIPGSAEAIELKARLSARGLWSQYLEVGLGEYPEVFTKGPVLSSVGTLAPIGIPSFSRWSNPEPELVLIANSQGVAVGATLGNDVNLRDIEGRSALLLGMAKDNNRSTAIGPFIRVFDDSFGIDEARSVSIDLEVSGTEGFVLRGQNRVEALSRSFEQLLAAAHGAHHQYPDGFTLFTGSLFAPTEDRTNDGMGFTHELGDVVAISSSELGSLINVIGRTEHLQPWTYGIGELMGDLAKTDLEKV